jgi:hypothetical protein
MPSHSTSPWKSADATCDFDAVGRCASAAIDTSTIDTPAMAVDCFFCQVLQHVIYRWKEWGHPIYCFQRTDG